MKSFDERSIMAAAILHYGPEAQLDKAIEEFAELIEAICHYKLRGLEAMPELLEELSDASIMVDQVRIMVSESEVLEMREKKLMRLQKQLTQEGFDWNE